MGSPEDTEKERERDGIRCIVPALCDGTAGLQAGEVQAPGALDSSAPVKGKILDFQREGITKMLADLQKEGTAAAGVVTIIYRHDGSASFRLTGFEMKGGCFLLAGLLQWIMTDTMADADD